MVKLANLLNAAGYQIDIVQWKYNNIPNNFSNICILDVNDYVLTVHKLLDLNEYSAIILGAAVANLVPSKPYSNKFPSHNYKVGDTFNIEFTIAPRLINMIKKWYPKLTLIGFKCSTGCYLDAVSLQELSKADLVVWNDPNILNNVTLVYKTQFHESIVRDNLSSAVVLVIKKNQYPSAINFTHEYGRHRGFNYIAQTIDINRLLQYVELQKYIFNDTHGAILISSLNNKYMLATPRTNKFDDICLLNFLDNTITSTNDFVDLKLSQAIPHLLNLHDELAPTLKDNYKYMVHCHQKPKNINLFLQDLYMIDEGYFAPNMIPLITNTLTVRLIANKIIVVNSKNAGYYILATTFSEVIKLFTHRLWQNYNPPKRYLRINLHKIDHNDEWYYVGGGLFVPQKYNIDPYRIEDSEIKLSDIKKVKFINSLPIVGKNVFDLFTRASDVIYFNLPKQWSTYRILLCIDDKNSLLMSVLYNEVVAHCLVRDPSKCSTLTFVNDLNVLHAYDKITILLLYFLYKHKFLFKISLTTASYHVIMKRM